MAMVILAIQDKNEKQTVALKNKESKKKQRWLRSSSKGTKTLMMTTYRQLPMPEVAVEVMRSDRIPCLSESVT